MFKIACCGVVLSLSLVGAQVPAPKPLTAMPYEPSLDVTSLDRTVDPCVDFYKFSCGGWMKNNPIPADQASWDVYSKLTNDNQQFLWGILEEDAAAKGRTPVQQKVGDYFESCMNTAAIDAKGMQPMAAKLAEIDALKTRAELLAALKTFDHRTVGSFFWGAGTGQDAVDSSTMIVEVGAGGLGLPDRDYYLKTDPKSVKLREQYVAYVTTLLTLSGESADKAKADAAAVLRIEDGAGEGVTNAGGATRSAQDLSHDDGGGAGWVDACGGLAGVLCGGGRAGGGEAECVAAGVYEGGADGADDGRCGSAAGVSAVSCTDGRGEFAGQAV